MKITLSNANRFHRVLLLTFVSLCGFFISQSTFAERYYGRGAHYACQAGYQLVLVPQHWSNGYLVPARYICAPVYQRSHYRHGQRYYYNYNGNRDGYYGRHHRNW